MDVKNALKSCWRSRSMRSISQICYCITKSDYLDNSISVLNRQLTEVTKRQGNYTQFTCIGRRKDRLCLNKK